MGAGEATISPSTFTVAPGASATFNFTLDVIGEPTEDWAYGHVVWTETSDAAPEVEMPVAVYVSASTDIDTLFKEVDNSTVLPDGSSSTILTSVTLSSSSMSSSRLLADIVSVLWFEV